MLPIETPSQLTVSQADKTMSSSTHKAVSNNPLLQFANKTGSLIVKNPFWVLVIGSIAIHAAFALISANPFKKTEPPREVTVSTLPVVKLPPKSLNSNTKQNKSLFDNLFVKPSTNKLGTSPDTSPSAFPNPFSNTFGNSTLRPLDLTNLERLEDLSPLATDLPLEVPPLSLREIEQPQFVKTQVSPSATPTSPSRFTPSGQLDNTAPVKTSANSNFKPEFQNSGLRNEPISPSNEIKNPKNTGVDPRSNQGLVSPSSANADRNAREVDSISSLYTTDKLIADLVGDNLIKNTQIVPKGALVSYPENNIEKGIAWISPKSGNIAGKKGTVTFRWLVDPNGEIKRTYYTPSRDKELDNLVLETVKEYKFKPIEQPKSGVYRLVTAKYDFPL
jgi:hypothetical protein